ncbi:Receptor expression-enhancing protein 1, partial [Durusdinium trenchii]
MAQDPYVELTILPWGDRVECKPASGTNPEWKAKHKNVMELPYYGRPVPPNKPELMVRVMDAEMTRASRLIGENTVNLTKHIQYAGEGTQELVVELTDAKDKFAGRVFLDFEMVLKGLVEVRCLEAYNLKNVQRFIEQDPYVKATFLPADEDGFKQTKHTKAASGVNPVWTKKHKNVLKFRYDGQENGRLLIEVLDKEYTQKDRLLGTGALPLMKRVVNYRATPDDKSKVSIDLVDADFVPA